MGVELRRRVRRAMAIRSFAVQGSWNPRTLLGAGFAFGLLPALRHTYRGDSNELGKAVGRHAAFFNSHPYLAPIALGAVARLEQDRADPALVERLKAALVSPLGTLGDRLVWARWRPLCAFLAVIAFTVGLPWWAAVLVFLVLYNVVHLALRIWGVELGWREGVNVGQALAGSPLRQVPDRLTFPLALSAGCAWPLVVGALVSPAFLALAAVAAAGGLRWPAWTGRLAAAALVGGAGVIALAGGAR